jgi:gluconolactonase
MAFDAAGEHLYVVRTATSDVVRYPILDFGRLGPAEPYGPPLGSRQSNEVGDGYMRVAEDAELAARWGFADGCAFDSAGNLWVTLVMSHSVVAITPAGLVSSVTVSTSDEQLVAPTSVCWAGDDMRDVYFGSLTAPYVVRGRSSVAGADRYTQN